MPKVNTVGPKRRWATAREDRGAEAKGDGALLTEDRSRRLIDVASGSGQLVFHLCIALVGPWALAQPGTKRLEFEIASMKPADPSVRTSNWLLGAGESLTIVNVPLRKIILYAYDIRDFQLAGGPGWVGDDRYDIMAKTATADRATFEAPAETDVQRRDRVARVRERLRSLLSDRFGLRVHVEERDQTILALRIAKGIPRLAEAAANTGRVSTVDGRIQGFGAPHFHACDTAFYCNRVDCPGRNWSGWAV